MPRYDFKSPRLYVDADTAADQRIDTDRTQANYLLNVLRLKQDDHVLLFNGRDGEWDAQIDVEGRKKATLTPLTQTRQQPLASDLRYLFAPLKQARMEYMVQKVVEMGAGVLQPVLTQYTQLRKVNIEKMRTHAIEAAEQCGILSIPDIYEPVTLQSLIDTKADSRTLIFCDEDEASQNPLVALKDISPAPLSILIGPEGGFSEEERHALRALPNTIPIPLGPRVLRADTAAVAALALVQSTLGDWRD